MRNYAYDMESKGAGWHCMTCLARLCRCPERTTDGRWEPICPNCRMPKRAETIETRCHCGRPSVFSDRMMELAREYLDSCFDDEEERVTRLDGNRRPMGYEIRSIVRLPNPGGMAVYLGVRRETLYDWADKHESFSNIMYEMKAMQEDRLINGSLSGWYTPTISKVLLTKHGYREGIDTTTNDKSLNDPVAKEKASDLIKKFLGNRKG